jgi:hypothetical protein
MHPTHGRPTPSYVVAIMHRAPLSSCLVVLASVSVADADADVLLFGWPGDQVGLGRALES